jgi:hypothetical protein
MTQRGEAAANAPAEDARADQRRLVQLIVAAVLMGATGVMLVVTGVWALIFEGSMSRELKGALTATVWRRPACWCSSSAWCCLFVSLEY